MSRKPCSCPRNRCINGNCGCFRDRVPCLAGSCTCKDCENTEDNKARVELEHNAYRKRKTGGDAKPSNGCSCQLSRCQNLRCSCWANDIRCTSNCKCQNCTNGEELDGSNTNTKPGQGSADGVSNVSDSNKQPRISSH